MDKGRGYSIFSQDASRILIIIITIIIFLQNIVETWRVVAQTEEAPYVSRF